MDASFENLYIFNRKDITKIINPPKISVQIRTYIYHTVTLNINNYCVAINC